MDNVTIVGLGWGDEGKGKIVDYLAKDMTCVVRCQGGNNAGHTIVVGDDEFKLHLIPSGILHPHVRCYLGAGVVIDLHTLKEEVAALTKRGIDVKGRLFISPYAHVILPTHRLLDHASEMLNGIGTTGKGIGPCYADAVLRKGVRIADLLSSSAIEKVKEIITSHNRLLETMHNVKGIDITSATNQLFEDLEFIQDFISHVEQDLMKSYQKGERILFEGAQGVLLDRTFGTYPFVTSSSTTPAGMLAAVGMPLKASGNIVGIIKAYATRVGSGPFPTELGVNDAFPFESAREIGTTTGRKRRIGWFDAVLTRFAIAISGANRLALTKLDILDELDTIYIATEYELHGQKIDFLPASAQDLQDVKPRYMTMKGWRQKTAGAVTRDNLPFAAQRYVQTIEELLGMDIDYISTGPERDAIINALT